MIEDGAMWFNTSEPEHMNVRKDDKWIKKDFVKDQEQLKALKSITFFGYWWAYCKTN